MAENIDYIRLVRGAQFGDKDCLDRLAEVATVRLRAHVYRLTLREDVTQDIVQESVLEMVKILGKLKRPDRFWPWLYGISLNKLRRYRRNENRHKNGTDKMSEIGFGGAQEDKQEALEKLLADELRQTVARAMQGVKERHRTVLSMRCYDGMSFAEIGAALGCSEFGAQMVFYRAKKSLAKQLARNGLSKGMLVGALVIFGKMTAASEAAAATISVTAATMKVAPMAVMSAVIASKAAVVTIAAAGVVTTGAVLMAPDDNESKVGGAGAGYVAPVVEIAESSPDGDDECWNFFPQGSGGPVMTRRMAGGDDPYCATLENEHGNYHYDRNSQTVFIDNFREYAQDMAVRRLPTDSQEIAEFLDGMEDNPSASSQNFVSTRRKDLLVIASQDQGYVTGISRVDRHENLLEEQYFQFAWPDDVRVVDRRDAMHMRGWTYFRVGGRLGDRLVYGVAQIPFVYARVSDHAAWLRLNVGQTDFVDTAKGAFMSRDNGETLRYRAGTFMKGLSRPWTGLHTIDTIRRDAAECRMIFRTENDESGKATVTVGATDQRLVYVIDLETDVVERIEIACSGVEGFLEFEYLQEIEQAAEHFVEPGVPAGYSISENDAGMKWLLEAIVKD